MEVLLAAGLLIYLPLTIVCSWVASQKNRSAFGHWLGAASFSPAFWMLVLIALPALTPAAPRQIAGERVDPTF